MSQPVKEVTEFDWVGASSFMRSKNREAVRSWLITRVFAEGGIDEQLIDDKQPFTRYGLNSMQVVTLSGELENYLERKISPTIFWEHPTLELLLQELT